MGLRIDAARCTGCGLCLKACAEGALRLENKKAVVDEEKCILCGLCAGACRFGAVAIQKEDAAAPQEGGGVWVFAEQRGGHVLPVVFELLAKGRELADLRASTLSAVRFSAEDNGQANELIARGADVVYLRVTRALQTVLKRIAVPLARLVAQRSRRFCSSARRALAARWPRAWPQD
jgi:electron transfer flavoprotein alpha subunit